MHNIVNSISRVFNSFLNYILGSQSEASLISRSLSFIEQEPYKSQPALMDPTPGRGKATLEDINLTVDQFNETNDQLTSQVSMKPWSSKVIGIKDEDELTKLLGTLKNYWTQLEDPLDERIQTVLREISSLSQDPRNELSRRYRRLVVLSGEDWIPIQDGLIDICMLGTKVLISSIKLATTAYSAVLSKNAKEAIIDISSTATDLKVILDNTNSQQTNFINSVEHLTLSWNNLTSSIANYTAEMDRKTLTLTQLGAAAKATSVKAPSTISDFVPDRQVGTRLHIIPGFSYKSRMGILTCTVYCNIGFTAQAREGIIIGKVIESLKKVKPLEVILNKDLEKLVEYLNKEDSLLTVYSSSTIEEKRLIVRKIGSQVPELNDQWVKMS